jgi:hypothetical protein
LSTIGHRRVFSLGRWSSLIPTGFHVPCGTREQSRPVRPFAYGAVTRFGHTFQSVRLRLTRLVGYLRFPTTVSQPRCSNALMLTLHRFRLYPLRSPLLRVSRLISFPPATEMFQFTGLSTPKGQQLIAARLPDSETCGSMPVSDSPQLFAAVHVLRRLSMPRHSPRALSSLTYP